MSRHGRAEPGDELVRRGHGGQWNVRLAVRLRVLSPPRELRVPRPCCFRDRAQQAQHVPEETALARISRVADPPRVSNTEHHCPDAKSPHIHGGRGRRCAQEDFGRADVIRSGDGLLHDEAVGSVGRPKVSDFDDVSPHYEEILQ